MKQTLFRNIVSVGILAISFVAGQAFAQRYSDDDAWHRDRSEFYAGQSWKIHMFDRVRQDLDHVQQFAFTNGDNRRLSRTDREISDLQSRLATGAYDQPELDDVIASLQSVVTDNRLSPDDRMMLNDDLSRIRDYRAHHEDWR